jgi:hypothetical protein
MRDAGGYGNEFASRTFAIMDQRCRQRWRHISCLQQGLPAMTATEQAKTELLAVIARNPPGTPPDAAMAAAVDAAAAVLEATRPAPDLAAMADQLDGTWTNLFSSQGILGEIDVAFMTRSLPGGGAPGGKARVHNVLQEIRLGDGFYRNMMMIDAGPDQVPILYSATADVAVAADRADGLAVRFKRFVFAPARADIGNDDVRRALALPATTPLALEIPADKLPPASPSQVSYLDGDIRINRGKDYIVVLRRVQ